MVVQAGFANGNHMRVLKFAQQPVQGRRGTGLQIQWMHANRAIDVPVTLGQILDRLRVLGADADTEEMPHTPRPRSIEGGVQGTGVLSEIETIKVTMGIY
ncbi:hypothetical protein D3C86_1776850 [compost metagenome]